MDYQKHHNLIITRARNRSLKGYAEQHHIIPRCMGGSDKPENLVDLLPEEHYVVHQLLIKIHPNIDELVYAAKMMTLNLNGNRPNNKLYGWLRRRFSKTMSERQKGVPYKIRYGEEKAQTVKANLSRSHMGIRKTEEAILKLKQSLVGRSYEEIYGSVEAARIQRRKRSDSQKGKSNYWKGKTRGPFSTQHRKRLSLTQKGVSWEEKFGKKKADEMQKNLSTKMKRMRRTIPSQCNERTREELR